MILLAAHSLALTALIAAFVVVLVPGGGPGSLRRLVERADVTTTVVAAAGIAALTLRGVALRPLSLVSAATLLLCCTVLPALALLPQEGVGHAEEGRRVWSRRVWIALGAVAMLGLAEGLLRGSGLGQVAAMQAVDQIGEVRLASFRPNVPFTDIYRTLMVQLFLVFPFFLLALPLFLPSVHLLWPISLFPTLQYLYQFSTAGSWLLANGARRLRAGPWAVLLLGLALHPLVLEKSSWDFVPPGALLFLGAYLAESRRRHSLMAACLALGALCHPIQALMAATWALDHARRERAVLRAGDRSSLAVAGIVLLAAAVPLSTLVFGSLLLPRQLALTQHLAPFGRRWVSFQLAQGDYGWIPAAVAGNVLKLLLLLLPLGFLPVARWNRFLAYGAAEIGYSMLTTNGFTHGSQSGFVGLMACAGLENVPRLAEAHLLRAARVVAVSLLPLTLLWGGWHFASVLLGDAPQDRVTRVAAALVSGDEERSCVGQTTTYLVLAGTCGQSSPLRFADGTASSLARAADVYILDLERLRESPSQSRSWGIWQLIHRVREKATSRSGPTQQGFDLEEDVAGEDLAWLRDGVRAGTLVVSWWRDGVVRLERRRLGRDLQRDATGEVLTIMDGVLLRRRAVR